MKLEQQVVELARAKVLAMVGFDTLLQSKTPPRKLTVFFVAWLPGVAYAPDVRGQGPQCFERTRVKQVEHFRDVEMQVF
jgi:hypothetical protein